MDEIKIQLTEVDQRCRSNTHRIDELKCRVDAQDDVVRTLGVLANEQTHIKTDVEEIKVNVKALADKPGKRWDALITTLIGIVVGAVMALVLSRIGL